MALFTGFFKKTNPSDYSTVFVNPDTKNYLVHHQMALSPADLSASTALTLDSTCQAPPRHYDNRICPPNRVPPISALATDSLRNWFHLQWEKWGGQRSALPGGRPNHLLRITGKELISPLRPPITPLKLQWTTHIYCAIQDVINELDHVFCILNLSI